MTDFIDEIEYYGLTARIKRLSDALNGEARKLYAHLNLDIEPNWHLVFLSLKEQPLSVTELAKRLRFSHPAIVKIINKMKKHGYIQSIQDDNDSRRQILFLTDKSKKLLPEYEKVWDRIRLILVDCVDSNFLDSIRFFESNIREKNLLQRLEERHSEMGAN